MNTTRDTNRTKHPAMFTQLALYYQNSDAIESMDLIAALMCDEFLDHEDRKRLADIHTLLSAVAKAQRD